jgi:GH18 family chitinase
LANSKTDEIQGGQWYWDSEGPFFWSFETADLIKQKFRDIVAARGLGGVAAWSLAEDSHDFALIKAIQSGVNNLSGDSFKISHVARHQRRAA